MGGRIQQQKRGRFISAVIQPLEPRLLMCANDGCPDPIASQPILITTPSAAPVSSGPLSPLFSIPALNSDPGAPATLYLDFHGEPSEHWGGQIIPATPAYDIDGDPTTFSTQELSNIQQIWSRVSEAYSLFNVNVTTVDPGNWNLNAQYPPDHALRVVIGGNGSWTGQLEGGLAYIGSYYGYGLPNTAYVFPTNLGGGNPQYTADDAVHEAGHGFGLLHQSSYNGTTKTSEYNIGNGTTAPFMGNPLSPNIRATWWDGQSSSGYNFIQDDLSILSGSDDGFGYRALTAGQSAPDATALSFSGTSFTTSGVIESTQQTDYFSFTTTSSGSDTFNVNVAQYGAMLHARIELHNSNNNTIAVAASASSLSQSLTATLAPGSYYLVLESYGQYGDVGQYSLSGTVAGASTAAPQVAISGAAAAQAGAAYALALSSIDPNYTINSWTINWGDGSAPQTVTGNPADATHTFAAGGNYSVSATVTDDAGTYSSNALSVAVTAPTNVAIAPATQTLFGKLPIKGRRSLTGHFSGKGSQTTYVFTLLRPEVVTFRLQSTRPALDMDIADSNHAPLKSGAGKHSVLLRLKLDPGNYTLGVGCSSTKPSIYHLVATTRPAA